MSLLGLYLAEDNNYLDRSVLTDEELEGVVNEAAALEPGEPTRKKFIKKVNKQKQSSSAVIPTRDLTIRSQYSIRAHMLPENIRKALASNAIKVVNNAFYRIMDFSGLKQQDLMLNADTKLSGVTNVNNRKLEENNYFLLTSIILQTATLTGNFGEPKNEILNGEFQLKNGDKVLIPASSCKVFDTKSKTNCICGEWKLDNPKFITPQTEIIPELKLPVAAPANTRIKLVLVGAGLVKA